MMPIIPSRPARTHERPISLLGPAQARTTGAGCGGARSSSRSISRLAYCWAASIGFLIVAQAGRVYRLQRLSITTLLRAVARGSPLAGGGGDVTGSGHKNRILRVRDFLFDAVFLRPARAVIALAQPRLVGRLEERRRCRSSPSLTRGGPSHLGVAHPREITRRCAARIDTGETQRVDFFEKGAWPNRLSAAFIVAGRPSPRRSPAGASCVFLTLHTTSLDAAQGCVEGCADFVRAPYAATNWRTRRARLRCRASI